MVVGMVDIQGKMVWKSWRGADGCVALHENPKKLGSIIV
jgi:hypothetical protein